MKDNRKKVVCLFTLLAVSSASFASMNTHPDGNWAGDNKVVKVTTVKGKVLDEKGEPIIGGTVTVNGTKRNAITDVNGNFAIAAKKGEQLTVSYIGYGNKTVSVDNLDQPISIVMAEDNHALNEVVVVGYSTNKKVNLSGSVSSLSGATLSKRPVFNVSSALQGMAAGVTVTTQSGQPGGNTGNIRIRGIGTFGGDSAEPLVLIDGVEGSMDDVDPNIIESISVLKDAASASIYGSRAANGVILVTTKRGNANERFGIVYKGYVGFQKPTALPDKVDAIEYMQLENKAYENDGGKAPYSDEYIEEYKKGMLTDPDKYPNTDWQDLTLTEHGFNQGHTVTMTNASQKVTALTSFGFDEQKGLVVNSAYRRVYLRNNMDFKPTKLLHIKLDFQVSNANKHNSPYEEHAFNYMNTRTPIIVNRFSTGLYNGSGLMGNNPILLLKEGGNVRKNTIRTNLAASLDYTLLKGWNIVAQFTPRYYTVNTHTYKNSVTTYGDPEGTTKFKSAEGYNTLSEASCRYFYWDAQLYSTFNRQLGQHSIKLMAGMETETYDGKTQSAYRQGFNYPQYDVINAGNIENMNNGGNEAKWAINSYFGRINYNYKERYLLEANLRTDGSSRFAKGHRYGVFPSFSGAWRISEEPFMSKVASQVQNLKLRASWGKLGNQNIGSSYYPAISSLTTGTFSMNDKLYPLATLTSLANSDLTWETSTMTDVGLDATLFNCLDITADWYYKTTDGILMKLDVPNIIGFGAPYQNAGKVRNVGWEIGVNYHHSFGDFTLGLGATLSDVHNKITDMHGTTSTNGDIRNQKGSSINSIYGLICDGFVNSQAEADEINAKCPQFGAKVYPGDLKYRDVNHDHKITTDDKTIIGSTIPRYTYSGTVNMDYKNLHLGLFFQGVGKADGYLNSYYVMPCYQGGTYRKEHLDYWTEENHNASTPRLSYASSNNTYTSSFWMKSSAYLRLKNIQLGYNLPQKWIAPLKLKSAYLYVNATNLFTWTNFWQGYDPEVNYDASATDGVALGSAANYPQVKTFTFGVEIKF